MWLDADADRHGQIIAIKQVSVADLVCRENDGGLRGVCRDSDSRCAVDVGVALCFKEQTEARVLISFEGGVNK